MNISLFAVFLSSFIFYSFVSTSNISLKLPPGYLFSTKDTRDVITTIAFKNEKWLKSYLTTVKETGYDLNHSFEDGNTLLHLSIMDEYPVMVKILLELGADVYKANSQNESPLDYITSLVINNRRYEEVWKIFESAGYTLPKVLGIRKHSDESEESGDPLENVDRQPAKIARFSSKDEEEILNAPLCTSPLCGNSPKKLDLEISEGFKEFSQIFSENVCEIPPKYNPVFPIQIDVDSCDFDIGEVFKYI